MHFDKERWERIRMFADAHEIAPQKFVEACIDAVCLAQLQTDGPAIVQRALSRRKGRKKRGPETDKFVRSQAAEGVGPIKSDRTHVHVPKKTKGLTHSPFAGLKFDHAIVDDVLPDKEKR
jgi:hypothetical protein